MRLSPMIAAALAAAIAATAASAQSSADLAEKLSNPVAAMISVPFQYNYNDGFLGGDAEQGYVNIQPVIPISLNDRWNVISRTILPVVYQTGFKPDGGSQFGFGLTTQSFFLSPKAPTDGIIWGVGPAFQLPTATDDIANNQWGAGVTAVALKQTHGWTVGMLANQIWSVSGADRYGETSAAFLQPFVSYTTPKATSFTLNTESTYDWEDTQWSVPINAMVAQIVKIGGKPIQLTAGARYWAEAPEDGPDGWGLRLAVTYLFPKG